MDDFDLSEWLHESESPPPIAQPSLTSQEIAILNYCEQCFWSEGLLPTVEKIQEDLGFSTQKIKKAFLNEVLINQLASRGIDLSPVVSTVKGHLSVPPVGTKALTAKQIVVANLMLNLHDKRTEREKLQFVGVSSQQYHAWLRNPQFQEFLRKRGEALFSSSDFEAYKSLVRNVKAGDNKALEMFFQMRGIWNPKLTVDINIRTLMVQVIEVITKHVKDPTQLQNIAEDLQNIAEAV